MISSQGTEKCLLRSVLKTVHMLNCLVKRLLGCGFQRFENACFDIFPQRFSSEFQVFNVFHNRLNRPMGRTRFFQPQVVGFGMYFLLFGGINRLEACFRWISFRCSPGFPPLFLHVLRVGSDVGGEACSTRDLPSPGVQKHLR